MILLLKYQQVTKMKLTSGQKINILGITICLVIVISFSYGIEKKNRETKIIESFIGNTIIIGKDTLIVTNYNHSHNTYDLSNRVIIDKEYVMKNAK
jgi:hypothetical protein